MRTRSQLLLNFDLDEARENVIIEAANVETIDSGVLGDSPVAKAPSTRAQGPEFKPQQTEISHVLD